MGTRDQELLQQLNLEPLWIPFTANRQFKAQPRLLVAAKDMYYTAHDGRQILDGIAGLWAVNAGHCRKPIVEAIKKQAESLDYATGFQMHSPGPFLAADRLVQITPKGMDHVFFVNSGLGGGGHRAQDRARLPPRARRGHPPGADRPRARLPWRGLRRHLRRRHDRQPQDLQRSAPSRRRSPAATRTTWRTTRTPAANPSGARTSRTIWNGWSRCTMRPTSRQSSSSRWPAPPAC